MVGNKHGSREGGHNYFFFVEVGIGLKFLKNCDHGRLRNDYGRLQKWYKFLEES